MSCKSFNIFDIVINNMLEKMKGKNDFQFNAR